MLLSKNSYKNFVCNNIYIWQKGHAYLHVPFARSIVFILLVPYLQVHIRCIESRPY